MPLIRATKSTPLQLSIIIVNYNVKYFLEQCLHSVRAACRAITAEVIVVDNASADESMAYLLDKFPEVIFIDNPVNLGFSKANNQGLAQARGRYVLFLNPDTILPEEGLSLCMQFLEKDPAAGACGVRMIDGSGRFLPESKRSFPDVSTSFYKLSGLTRLFPRSARFGRYHLSNLSEHETAAVDILSGAFFMAKKSVLDQTGGFDEAFFMYGEDIDLSYRIRQKGFKNFYFAGTTIVHFKGESTRKGTLNYVRMFYSAMSIFVRKHYRTRGSAQMQLLIRLSIWFRAGLSVVKNAVVGAGKSPQPASGRMVIVAGESEAVDVTAMVRKHNSPQSIEVIAPAEHWQQTVLQQGLRDLLFCVGPLSYHAVIAAMDSLPKDTAFYIHASGSGSIVGSGSKNSGGQVISR